MGGIVSRKTCLTLTAEEVQICCNVWEAAAKGNVSELRKLCALLPMSVSARNYDLRAAMHLACAEGQLEAVKFLVDQGAEASICDRWGQEPIREAMQHGHSSVVNFLLEKKVQLSNICRAELEKLMCSSASKGDLQTIKTLVKTGVSTNSVDYDNRTALHIAAASGHMEVVNYLISHRANVHPDACPMGASFSKGKTEIYAGLQGAGESKESRRSIDGMAGVVCSRRPSLGEWTRMMFPLSGLSLKKIQIGNLSSFKTSSAATYQLISASACGDVRTLNKILLTGAAKVNDADHDARTALHLACAEGHFKAAKFLISNGADLEAKDRWGNVPLQDAIRGGHVDIAHLLTQAGASSNAANSADIAFKLCAFAYQGNVHQVSRLLNCGVSPDVTDLAGRTPLMLAAAAGHLQTVKYLLSKGADFRRMDNCGYTAVTTAAGNGHSDVMRLLDDAASKQAIAVNAAHKQKNPRDSLAADCLVKALLTSFAATVSTPSPLKTSPVGEPSGQSNSACPLSAVTRDSLSVLFLDVAGFSRGSEGSFTNKTPDSFKNQCASACNNEVASSFKSIGGMKTKGESVENFPSRRRNSSAHSKSCRQMEDKKQCELPSCRPARSFCRRRAGSCTGLEDLRKRIDSSEHPATSSISFGRTSSGPIATTEGMKQDVSSEDQPPKSFYFRRTGSVCVRTEEAQKKAEASDNKLGSSFYFRRGACARTEEMKRKCELSGAITKLFARFDELAEAHGVQRVGVVCDTYIAAANVAGDEDDDHASRLARFAIAALECAAATDMSEDSQGIRVKIKGGLHSGRASVVRAKQGSTTLGGDIIGLTSVMVVNSIPGRIQCSEAAAQLIASQDPAVYLEPRDTRLKCDERRQEFNTCWLCNPFKSFRSQRRRISRLPPLAIPAANAMPSISFPAALVDPCS